MQTLSGEKQGSWTASQSLAKGLPEGWMKDGEQHSSTGFVTAASTAPYAFFLPVTLLLSPHANNCLSLCWVTRKWISPLLDIKKPVYCQGSVFCGTQWSRRLPVETCLGRLASWCGQGSQMPSSDVPQVAKDVLSSHSEQTLFLCWNISRYIIMPNVPFLTSRSSNYVWLLWK